MIQADFHTHTAFSSDSTELPENIIEQAIHLGLDTICITDHYDHLFPEQYKERFTFDLDAYFQKLFDCRERYRGKIRVLCGAELGLRDEPDVLSDCVSFYKELAVQYPFDFFIGSVHILEHTDPYYPEYWQSHEISDGMTAYFDALLTGVKHYNMFHVLGHLDYLVRYFPDHTNDYQYSKYKDQIDEILKLLIEQGRGIELNTAGYKYGLPYPHPRPEILARYRELGGEILTIGSDGHTTNHLAYNFSGARELLLSLGYRYYTVYENQKPEFKNL